MSTEKPIGNESKNTNYLDELKKISKATNLPFDEKAEKFQKAMKDAKEAGVPLEEIIKTLKELKNNKSKN